MRESRPKPGISPSDICGPLAQSKGVSKIANTLGGRPNVYSGSYQCP